MWARWTVQVSLPSKSSSTHEVRLSADERRIYDRLYKESRWVIYALTYCTEHLACYVSWSFTGCSYLYCLLTEVHVRVSTTTLGQFQSGVKTILFRLAYGTWLGAFVTFVRLAPYKYSYLLTYLLTCEHLAEIATNIAPHQEEQFRRDFLRHICSVDTQGDSALDVLRNRAL